MAQYKLWPTMFHHVPSYMAHTSDSNHIIVVIGFAYNHYNVFAEFAEVISMTIDFQCSFATVESLLHY